MNEWNDLFAFNEADEEDKKDKKETEKKDDDKKEEKETEKKDEKNDEDTSDDYNDLIDDGDVAEDDTADEDLPDSDDDYNDLMDDDSETDFSDNDTDLPEDSEDSSDESDGDYNTLVVAVSDGDSEDGSVYEKAAKSAYAFTVIANNMKHIHLNVCGDKFEEIHRLCDEYYYHFTHLADNYYELAAESPLITLDNPTRAKEHCEDVSVEMEKEYNFKSALEAISSNLESAIKYMGELREASETIRKDIQSRVDEELLYLNKQSRYFIRKRLAGSVEDTAVGESYNYNDLF